MNGIANEFGRGSARNPRRSFDRLEHLLGSAAEFVDAIRIAIEHFEHGQRAFAFRKFTDHFPGRADRHHGVKADVILAAKGPDVRKRRGLHELFEFRAGFQVVDQGRNQFSWFGILEKSNERFEFAEAEFLGRFAGPGRRQPQVGGETGADAGHDHSFA